MLFVFVLLYWGPKNENKNVSPSVCWKLVVSKVVKLRSLRQMLHVARKGESENNWQKLVMVLFVCSAFRSHPRYMASYRHRRQNQQRPHLLPPHPRSDPVYGGVSNAEQLCVCWVRCSRSSVLSVWWKPVLRQSATNLEQKSAQLLQQ